MADAIIHTSRGDIAFDFFNHCPDAVGNFVDLAIDIPEGKTRPFYDGTQFNTRTPGFAIEGGNPAGVDSRAADRDDYILNEYSETVQFDQPWRVATIARGDFGHPSLFFITLRTAEHLNWHNTIFGEVTDQQSRDVVVAINGAPLDEVVTIEHIEIRE